MPDARLDGPCHRASASSGRPSSSRFHSTNADLRSENRGFKPEVKSNHIKELSALSLIRATATAHTTSTRHTTSSSHSHSHSPQYESSLLVDI
jgi:hypothetical protein